jgi:hypothetical protein
MSRTYHHGERRIRVKAIKRDKPDLRKLGRALIEMARLEAEAEADERHRQRPSHRSSLPPRDHTDPPGGKA